LRRIQLCHRTSSVRFRTGFGELFETWLCECSLRALCSSCFPHVVNIGVDAFLDELKRNPDKPLRVLDTKGSEKGERLLNTYVNALRDDPVGQARILSETCRESGQRREQIIEYIQQGNRDGSWTKEGDRGSSLVTLPAKQLLKSSPTRWSSRYNQGERVLEMHEASMVRLQQST
jgi:hypothetical protein